MKCSEEGERRKIGQQRNEKPEVWNFILDVNEFTLF